MMVLHLYLYIYIFIYMYACMYIPSLLRNLYHFIWISVNPFASGPSMKFEGETLNSISIQFDVLN